MNVVAMFDLDVYIIVSVQYIMWYEILKNFSVSLKFVIFSCLLSFSSHKSKKSTDY